MVRRLFAGTAVAAVVAGGLAAPAQADLLGSVNAIVQGPSVSAVELAVSSVGGQTLTELPLVNGVLASLPSMAAANTLQSLGYPTGPDAPVAVDSLAGATTSNPNTFPTETGATKLGESRFMGELAAIVADGRAVAALQSGATRRPRNQVSRTA